jgi:hypothetical protein
MAIAASSPARLSPVLALRRVIVPAGWVARPPE